METSKIGPKESAQLLARARAAISAAHPVQGGMPASYVIGSDQYGGKIVAHSPSRHRVTFQNESGRITHEFTRRRNGTYYALGSKYGYLKLGVAKTALDEGF
jgi:hypothetical protein